MDFNSLTKFGIKGFEPAGEEGSTPANKQDSELSSEALTHILTNLTDEDRRMLSQIVERWGDLSDDLKRAVLAVVEDRVPKIFFGYRC